MADMLKDLVAQITTVFGERVRSIILYGSRAGEEAVKRSDYNVLVILDEIPFDGLTELARASKSWTRKGNPPPLMFSKQMFGRSSDVFPIEFLDMKDTHTILYGEDPFKELTFTGEHLRHACEFELKGKLLKLRQAYLSSAAKPAKVRELLIGSLAPFLVVFRHTVRLFGEEPLHGKVETLDRLAQDTGCNPHVFKVVAAMKAGDRSALATDPVTVMEEYLHQIEIVVQAVDVCTGKTIAHS